MRSSEVSHLNIPAYKQTNKRHFGDLTQYMQSWEKEGTVLLYEWLTKVEKTSQKTPEIGLPDLLVFELNLIMNAQNKPLI